MPQSIIKEVFLTIYEQMLAESKRLEAEINSLRLQLNDLPEGNMFCSHNGKYTKWYYRNEKRQIYIPKSNRPLAEALAAKKYLQLRLQDLITEKASIDSYLKNHKSNPLTSDQFLMNSPEYQELLSSFFTPTSLEISAWLNSPFEKT